MFSERDYMIDVRTGSVEDKKTSYLLPSYVLKSQKLVDCSTNWESVLVNIGSFFLHFICRTVLKELLLSLQNVVH